MKKALLSVLGLSILLAGCQNREEVHNENEESDLIEVSISVSDGEETIAYREAEVEEGTKLIEVMEEEFDLEQGEGGFITAIEGVEQVPDENKWWVFEVNDEMVNEGAEGFVLADGDEVDWELMSFE